ncbi:MAG: hypothetical protein LBQ54_00925 [Planctomycetaceae bacterium]|jgi:hypothetical protein|nr:hypothetical protein [Planctomycetaceae bacterium]
MSRYKDKSRYGKQKFGVRGSGKQGPLTYFYTTDQWEKARNSAGFQAWANGRLLPPPVKITVTIEPRPVMQIAQEEINEKIPHYITVAEKQFQKK